MVSLEPGVTVAVCTRNRPGVLQTCLDHVLSLDPQPDRILIADQSDAGWSERVRDLCGYGFDYLGVEPRGLGFSRRAVLNEVRTQLLAFTDDDCRPRSTWVGKIVAAFDRWPRAGAVTGASRPDPAEPPDPGWPSWVTCWGDDEVHVYRGPADPADLGGGLNMAFRVDALRDIGGFDPLLGPGAPLRSADDHDALYRLLRAAWEVVYDPEVVVSHHPVRDRLDHERNERDYAFGTGAWAAKGWRQGDPFPGRVWRRTLGRTLSHMVRRAPFDGMRRSRQRWTVAVNLVRGWSQGARIYRDPDGF